MKASYSRIDCFKTCPYQYKLRYIDKIKVDRPIVANDPLFLGTSIHEGIEHRSIQAATDSYKSNYSILDEVNELEMFKLETALSKAIKQVPEGDYELKLDIPNEFIGYIDMVVDLGDGVVDLYDFKHSNSIDSYLKSGQLHVYKYYYEQLTGNKVRNMYYTFIPKFKDVLTEGTDIIQFQKDIIEFYKNNDVQFKQVIYDPGKVQEFFQGKRAAETATTFERKKSWKCPYCDYREICNQND